MRSPQNGDHWAVAPDAEVVVIGRSDHSVSDVDHFTIEAIHATRGVIFRRQFAHKPIPVTEEERNRSYAGHAEDLIRTRGISRAKALEDAMKDLPMPSTRTALDYVFVASDHRIWLHRRDMTEYLFVLDGQTGQELARILMPDDGTYPGIAVDGADAVFLWMYQRDDLGIPRLVRYRIDRNPLGSGG